MHDLTSIRNYSERLRPTDTVDNTFYMCSNCTFNDFITLFAKALLDEGKTMTEEDVCEELDEILRIHIDAHRSEEGEAWLLYIGDWAQTIRIVHILYSVVGGVGPNESLTEIISRMSEEYSVVEGGRTTTPATTSVAELVLVLLFDALKENAKHIVSRAKEILEYRRKEQFPEKEATKVENKESHSLKLLWMGTVNIPAYKRAAAEATPDQRDNRWPEDFIERYDGPFDRAPHCNELRHMLPDDRGFVPDYVDEEQIETGVWWSLGVQDSLGREIDLVMEHEPDMDYISSDLRFAIYTTTQPQTIDDIEEILRKYEPAIDHWWCHTHLAKENQKTE